MALLDVVVVCILSLCWPYCDFGIVAVSIAVIEREGSLERSLLHTHPFLFILLTE
jgi:hypothetical protein